jgi:hypothetical protein
MHLHLPSLVYNSTATDSKTLSVLEYPKILERLAGNCGFPASVNDKITQTHDVCQLTLVYRWVNLGGTS